MSVPAYQSFEDIFKDEDGIYPISTTPQFPDEELEERFPTSIDPPPPPTTKKPDTDTSRSPAAGKRSTNPKSEESDTLDLEAMFKAAKGLNVEEMMNSLLKVLEPSGSSVREEIRPEIELRNLGLVVKMGFIVIMRFLGWFISKTESWLPMHVLFENVHRRSFKEILENYWDDIFDTPDTWLSDRLPEYLYQVIDSFFYFVFWVMKRNRLTIPLVAFVMGYVL